MLRSCWILSLFRPHHVIYLMWINEPAASGSMRARECSIRDKVWLWIGKPSPPWLISTYFHSPGCRHAQPPGSHGIYPMERQWAGLRHWNFGAIGALQRRGDSVRERALLSLIVKSGEVSCGPRLKLAWSC